MVADVGPNRVRVDVPGVQYSLRVLPNSLFCDHGKSSNQVVNRDGLPPPPVSADFQLQCLRFSRIDMQGVWGRNRPVAEQLCRRITMQQEQKRHIDIW